MSVMIAVVLTVLNFIMAAVTIVRPVIIIVIMIVITFFVLAFMLVLSVLMFAVVIMIVFTPFLAGFPVFIALKGRVLIGAFISPCAWAFALMMIPAVVVIVMLAPFLLMFAPAPVPVPMGSAPITGTLM